MSIQAMTRVMEHSEAQGMTRLVLLIMANRAGGDDDVCFASVERIAFEARVHPRTVQRAVRWMCTYGDLVDVGVHSRYRTNSYRVMPMGVAESHPPGESGPLTPPKQEKQGLGVVVVPTDPHSTSKPKARKRDPKNPHQPTHDQIYLGEALGSAWGQELGVPAIVKLNKAHGRANVESAMRSLKGFPPEEAVRSLYAYIGEVASLESASG